MAQVEFVPDVAELWEVVLEGPLADPLSILMLALGGLLIGVAVAIFGGLSVGGVLSMVVRAAKEQSPRG
ncbi:hypothetical protein BRD00_12560 [Halobacteriales archaeon QS_8_69_26]|nr:MAG: hypothetical protein BRD00_12560 [Halobacteriales archaeon QS_8_69_26]